MLERQPFRSSDLTTPDEIAELVRRFYADVVQDPLLGPVFDEVAQVDWSAHLPKLTAFWCRILLSIPGFEGNAYTAHLRIHQLTPFTVAHFERWLELFCETVDTGWEGPRAEQAKEFAHRVAEVHCRQLAGVELADALATAVGPTTGEPSA